MLACKICSRTSDRDREIENLREDREAILAIDARESKEECCDALRVLARHHDDCKSSLRSMGVTSRPRLFFETEKQRFLFVFVYVAEGKQEGLWEGSGHSGQGAVGGHAGTRHE